MPSTIVLDASLTLHALLPGEHKQRAIGVLDSWIDAGRDLSAPALWLAECTTGIRRAVHSGEILLEDGQALLRDLGELPVLVYPLNVALCESAFAWASRLGQSRAYDGFYLALAEQLQAECWTTDRRLANGARQLGIDWMRTLEDIGGSEPS